MDVLGVSVVDLLADLLGQGELNSLAGGSSQLCDALLLQLDVVHDLGDGDALLLGEVLARDPDQVNGLLDALLDGLGEGNLDVLDVLSDDGHVVVNLLGNLLAVVVAVPVVSVAMVRLVDGDHLGVALLGEGNGDGLGGDGNHVLAVGVDADLVVNNLNTLTAHGAGHRVALLDINDLLGGNLDGLADCLKGGGADLSGLNNIDNTAVVLGGMVGVVDRGVHNSVVSNSMVGSVVDHGGGMVHSVVGNWGSMVDSVVSHRSGVVNSVVGNRSMMNSSMKYWSVVDSSVVNCSMVDRGMMDSRVMNWSMMDRGSVNNRCRHVDGCWGVIDRGRGMVGRGGGVIRLGSMVHYGSVIGLGCVRKGGRSVDPNNGLLVA